MHTFTLKDADGVEHLYAIIPHGSDEGERIMWQLDAAAVGPLGAVLQSAIGAMIAGEMKFSDLMTQSVSSVLGAVDVVGATKDLAALLRSPDITKLSESLLRHMTRDGQPLSDVNVRRTVYQRNYVELRRALFEAIRYNRFFPLPGA